jgi:hypothetical protein
MTHPIPPLSPEEEPSLLDALCRFNSIWRLLSRDAKCDEVYSAEYWRVVTEWLCSGRPVPISAFIHVSANRPPVKG